MAILNFEEYTHDLSDYELSLVPRFVKSLQTKIGKENAVTAKIIEERMLLVGQRVSGPRIRKIVNYIRNMGLVEGLVATSSGYYITKDHQEISAYIESLEGREGAIRVVREGMEAYLRRLKNQNYDSKD